MKTVNRYMIKMKVKQVKILMVKFIRNRLKVSLRNRYKDLMICCLGNKFYENRKIVELRKRIISHALRQDLFLIL